MHVLHLFFARKFFERVLGETFLKKVSPNTLLPLTNLKKKTIIYMLTKKLPREGMK